MAAAASCPAVWQRRSTEDLGGLDKFKADFTDAGVGQFGSGWCWLSVKNGKLEISKTANGESPLVRGATPILGCDVWEHSYYIDYRNRHPDYLKAFFDNLINRNTSTSCSARLPDTPSFGVFPRPEPRTAIPFRPPPPPPPPPPPAVAAATAPFSLRPSPSLPGTLPRAAQAIPPDDFADVGNAAMSYLLVFIGGGLGSTLRHLINVTCARCFGTGVSLGHLHHQHYGLPP